MLLHKSNTSNALRSGSSRGAAAQPKLRVQQRQQQLYRPAAASAPSIAPAASPAAAEGKQAANVAGGALTTKGIVYHDPKWNSVSSEQEFFATLEVGDGCAV